METTSATNPGANREPTTWERTTTRRFLKWLFSWQTLRALLILGGGFLTLVVLFYAVENWRGARAYNAVRQADEARGESYDYRKLIPPPVPDDQNFAMSPMLKPLLDIVPDSHPIKWRDTNAYKRVTSVRADHMEGMTGRSARAAGREGRSAPGFPSFAGTNLIDLSGWQAFYHGNTNYPQPAAPGTPAADILVALSKYDSELKELQQGAARPLSRFAVNYEYEDPYAILLPHLASMKGLVITVVLRATARLEAGQSDLALQDLKLALRLAESFKDEPILISHLVRIATLGMCVQCAREGLARHAWNEAQLADLQRQLAGIDLLHGYKQSMRAERAWSIKGLEYYHSKGSLQNLLDWNATSDNEFCDPLGFKVFPMGWVRQNLAMISQYIQSYGLDAVDEKVRRFYPDKSGALEKAVEARRKGPYTFLAKMLLPALGRCAQKSAFGQWGLDAGQLACALERYRLAQGKFPDRLEDLVPKYIDKLPRDLISGEPFKYQPAADGTYKLISVGWNQKDDGGQIVYTKSKQPSPISTEGDWVWTCPVRQER